MGANLKDLLLPVISDSHYKTSIHRTQCKQGQTPALSFPGTCQMRRKTDLVYLTSLEGRRDPLAAGSPPRGSCLSLLTLPSSHTAGMTAQTGFLRPPLHVTREHPTQEQSQACHTALPLKTHPGILTVQGPQDRTDLRATFL